MAAYFFDSSALVKRYVREPGTTWVIQLLDPTAGNKIHVARITGAEVVSAITRNGVAGNLVVAYLS
jgi:predicted nucleic acid-binding protein